MQKCDARAFTHVIIAAGEADLEALAAQRKASRAAAEVESAAPALMAIYL